MGGEPAGSRGRSVLVAALVAAVLCGGFQLLFGHVNLNLRDEGYLWYGVVQVLAGDVPLRDFQAYDPGRYYWCAALAPLFGDGIVGVRAGVMLFAAVGMFLGLLTARRFLPGDVWLVPVGVLLLLWFFPRHKLFEHAITLIAVWSATRLLEAPTVRRHLASGVVVGLAAFLGRNHGLYLALAFLVLLACLRFRRAEPDRMVTTGGRSVLLAWGGGVVLGYAPLLLMLVVVPGFASGFVDAIVSIQSRGANIPSPYRWPWVGEHAGPALSDLVGAFALDLAYLLPVVALPLGLVAVLRTPASRLAARAPLVAAAVIGTVYVHHYAVRSDLPHLAQAIAPVLLVLLALASERGKRVLGGVLAFLVLLATWVAFEGSTELKVYEPGGPVVRHVDVDVRGETLKLKKFHGGLDVQQVQEVFARLVPEDAPIFVGPTMPTYYPVLGRRSPSWWIYFLWPAEEGQEEALIEDLRAAGVDWALIVMKPFGKDPAYNFDRTYPEVWRHLAREWQLVQDEGLPQRYLLFRRRP
jgi:hypothetical protein